MDPVNAGRLLLSVIEIERVSCAEFIRTRHSSRYWAFSEDRRHLNTINENYESNY